MSLRKWIAPPIVAGQRGDSGAARNRRLIVCLALFVCSLLEYWPTYYPNALLPRGQETTDLARNLLATGPFANPFSSLDTGPSAHLAPAFPAFVAAIIWLFGEDGTGIYAYRFTAVLAVSLLLGLLPLASRLLGMGFLTGVLAVCIWLAAKLPLWYDWEATHASLLIVMATCCFRRLLGSAAPHLGITLLLGLLMGLLALLIPICIPIFVCWLIWLALSWKASLFWAPAVALVVVPAMMVSPWIVRNYLVFDRIILVRDNLGLELSVSNNDCAPFSLQANLQSGCFMRFHPNGNVAEAAKIAAMGEARYNELRLHQAINWVTANPHRFMSLCAQRFVAFWFPHHYENLTPEIFQEGRRARGGIYLMTLLSVIGLWITARRDIKSAAVCAIWLCVFPMIYYVVQFEDRYRYPIMWVTFLLGAVPLSVVVERLWSLSIGSVPDGGIGRNER